MNWWIICFLELTFLDHIFSTPIGGSFVFWNLHFLIIYFPHKLMDPLFFGTYILHLFFSTQIGGSIWCFVLALRVTFTTRWIIFLDTELVDHMSAWMVREIMDHFAGQWGGGVDRVGDPRSADHFGGGGGLDPRGSVIRGLPPTNTYIHPKIA